MGEASNDTTRPVHRGISEIETLFEDVFVKWPMSWVSRHPTSRNFLFFDILSFPDLKGRIPNALSKSNGCVKLLN